MFSLKRQKNAYYILKSLLYKMVQIKKKHLNVDILWPLF